MTEYSSLHFEREIRTPAEEVFRAFTHPTALRDWLCNAASAEPRRGGHIFLQWDDGYYAAGAFTSFEPFSSLAFTWDGFREPGVMAVRITLSAQDDGARVSLEHTGLGGGAEWADTRRSLPTFWRDALENLQSFLDHGLDLRLARRPRLGIFIGEFNSHIAAQMGFPVSEGVLLEGVADGSGAQAAGLQKDDLLVSLNGVALTALQSFAAALQGLKAGDRPLVEYYRGAEKRTIPLLLGSFPVLRLPESPAELADAVRQTNARIHGEISALVSTLSEDQAAQRPRSGEWSVNELIGHFILTEREYQSWAANMLRDNITGDSLEFRPNVDERIAALVVRFSTCKGLLDELALAQEETAELLASLPESFTKRRKHFYRRLAQWALEVTPGHFDEEHLEQFKSAIAAVSA